MNHEQGKPLPDIITYGLKVLLIGYNPSLRSAEKGHHYAGRSNRFWDILYRAGLTPEKLDYTRDRELPDYGYGSTNIVDRPTKAADEITRQEYIEGKQQLRLILEQYKPRIACYTGIGVYKAFAGKNKAVWGLQDNQVVPGILDFVAPSTSGLNRMPIPKQIELYRELKDLVDKLKNR